jgi:hypothetical protein
LRTHATTASASRGSDHQKSENENESESENENDNDNDNESESEKERKTWDSQSRRGNLIRRSHTQKRSQEDKQGRDRGQCSSTVQAATTLMETDGDVEQGKGSTKGNNVMERDNEGGSVEEQDKGTTGPFNVLLLGEFGYLLAPQHYQGGQAQRFVCVRERVLTDVVHDGEDRAGKTSLADRISPVAQVEETASVQRTRAPRPTRPVNLANGPRVLLNIVDTCTMPGNSASESCSVALQRNDVCWQASDGSACAFARVCLCRACVRVVAVVRLKRVRRSTRTG